MQLVLEINICIYLDAKKMYFKRYGRILQKNGTYRSGIVSGLVNILKDKLISKYEVVNSGKKQL